MSSKAVKELQVLTREARNSGYRINGGVNGGGWIRLAIACGLESNSIHKDQAKHFLRMKFLKPRESKPLGKSLPGRVIKATKPYVQPPPPDFRVSKVDPNSPAFLESFEWRTLRLRVFACHGHRCMCCGATPAHGFMMHVDHIKPRKKRPDLALDFNNLQVLCEVCNHGKSNWDETDWRPPEESIDADVSAFIRSIARGSD